MYSSDFHPGKYVFSCRGTLVGPATSLSFPRFSKNMVPVPWNSCHACRPDAVHRGPSINLVGGICDGDPRKPICSPTFVLSETVS